MLPTGKLFVLGGEYTGSPSTQSETNTGEIYDPVANSWSNIKNYPNPQFGDAPTAVLPNGQILAGDQNNSQAWIYNPATNLWTAGPNKLDGDTSAEETWVKLPDQSILTHDLSGTTARMS